MRLGMTGVTSGVGMRLAEVAIARGDHVVSLVRDPDRKDARELAAKGVELVKGDLDDREALATVARGADAFLHLAAHVGDAGTREQFERVNVAGTRNAIEAAGREKVRRFVHLSSVAVYGRPDEGRVTEDWPTRKPGTPYEDTKTDAERIAFDRGRELGVEVAAVRPPIIYGPHDRNFLPRALDALAHHRFLLVDGGVAPLNVVSVDHVVDVLLRCADKKEAAGEAFNVMDEVDRRPPSVREIAETIAREAHLPRPRVSIPYGVAMALGHVVENVFQLLKRPGPPPLSPFVVKQLSRHVIYDASKAARLLGYAPKVSALEGIAKQAREASLKSGRRG